MNQGFYEHFTVGGAQKSESWLLTTQYGDGAFAAPLLVVNSPNFTDSCTIIRTIDVATFCVLNSYSSYFLLFLKVNFEVKNVQKWLDINCKSF